MAVGGRESIEMRFLLGGAVGTELIVLFYFLEGVEFIFVFAKKSEFLFVCFVNHGGFF